MFKSKNKLHIQCLEWLEWKYQNTKRKYKTLIINFWNGNHWFVNISKPGYVQIHYLWHFLSPSSVHFITRWDISSSLYTGLFLIGIAGQFFVSTGDLETFQTTCLILFQCIEPAFHSIETNTRDTINNFEQPCIL